MRITHLYHSGCVVELPECTLLFDWWPAGGALPALPQDKPLYVFVSHAHSDHFSPEIWKLADEFAELHYVVDAGVPVVGHVSGELVRVRPHERYQIGALAVETLESNDEGVAFVVEAPQADTGDKELAAPLRIYFAGDLNVWWWDRPRSENETSEAFCRTELARVAGRPFDVAFVPLDVRLAGNGCDRGIVAVMEEVGAQLVVPIHYSDRRAEAMTHLGNPELAPYQEVIDFSDVIELER